MVEVVWRGIASSSVERCLVEETAEGPRVVGAVSDDFGECSYELHADVLWRFRSLSVSVAGRTLGVTYDGETWAVDGRPRRDLDPAREVDLAFSPVSNTLPIRSLRMEIGDSVDIVTAYVTVPDLEVTADPQRYTRLSHHDYLYESRDSDFRSVVSVDDFGLVTSYPGLFERRDGQGPDPGLTP